jgi:hypothetical protein
MIHILRNRDISVSMVTGYGMDDQGSMTVRCKRFFSSPVSRPLLRLVQPLYLAGTRGSFSSGKADHVTLSSVEVKNV